MELTEARRLKQAVIQDLQLVATERNKNFNSRSNITARPKFSVGVTLDTRRTNHRVAIRIVNGSDDTGLDALLAKYDPRLLDIRVVGRITASQRISCGMSISHYISGAGTIACQVFDRSTGAPMLLSNNHVIGYNNRAVRDDAIIQPGEEDGGRRGENTIARFVRSVPLDFDNGGNSVDCAIALLEADIEFEHGYPDGYRFVPDAPIEPITQARPVCKIGRTSNFTRGWISAIDIDDLPVDYSVGTAVFSNQIEVSGINGADFARHGDSGALVVDGVTGAAIGLLFAVSDRGTAYVNPIDSVLSALDVQLTP